MYTHTYNYIYIYIYNIYIYIYIYNVIECVKIHSQGIYKFYD